MGKDKREGYYPSTPDVEELLTKDRGTLPYIVKFIIVFLLRLCLTLLVVLTVAGHFISVEGLELIEAILKAVPKTLWIVLLDSIWSIVSYAAYKYNPKSITFDSYVESDVWSRCTYRQINYFIVSLIPWIVFVIYIYNIA